MLGAIVGLALVGGFAFIVVYAICFAVVVIEDHARFKAYSEMEAFEGLSAKGRRRCSAEWQHLDAERQQFLKRGLEWKAENASEDAQ